MPHLNQKEIEFKRSLAKSIAKAREAFAQTVTMLDFFKSGFRLTTDDRFKDFRLEYSPWIKTLCAWFEDEATEWIWLVQGSQTSKTTFLMGALLYVAQYVPGAVPCLWVQSTEEEAKLFISERLRFFLDEAGLDTARDRTWKTKSFRVYNAKVKVGHATTKNTLRSKPARFLFCDECGIWKEPVSYVKKRSRTFVGKRKGFFATTPPEHGEHHSWQEATAGNVYHWWVPCPKCGEFQGLRFSQLKFDGKEDDTWNYELVEDTAGYQCNACGDIWREPQKIAIINAGKPVCVDPQTYEQCKERRTDTRMLQVSSLYSMFTTWGKLAADFLTAKASGLQAMRIFCTDELAEIPKEIGETLRHDLGIFCAERKRGTIPEGCQLLTIGCDVQRNGTIYWVVTAWQSGPLVSGHVVDYGKVRWKDERDAPSWQPFLEQMTPYQGKIYRVVLDATDGVEQPFIFDFCRWAGPPFVPLIDKGVSQMIKVQYKQIEINAPGRWTSNQFCALTVNSALVKDEIAAAFRRHPGEVGAWSFPQESDEEFFRHLRNEHRTLRKRAGALVSAWEPRYGGAPQHWWSALVYATAAMEDKKSLLQTTRAQEISPRAIYRYRNKGVEVWQ